MQDALMQDINVPRIGSSSEFSSGIMHSYSDPKQKLAAVRDYRQHYAHGSEINGLFGDRRIFYDHENTREDIWDGSIQFTFFFLFFNLYPLLWPFVFANNILNRFLTSKILIHISPIIVNLFLGEILC
jgi:hypothetical protein